MRKFELSEDQFKILMGYLGDRSYKEVRHIMSFMLNLPVIMPVDIEKEETSSVKEAERSGTPTVGET